MTSENGVLQCNLNISLNDLAAKLRKHGRHSMLSYLSSLSIAVFRLTYFTIEIIKCAMLHC